MVIAEQLSKLNRMDRRALSTKAYEKSVLSAQDGKPHYYLSSFATIDFGIICLFTSETREKRRERLGMLCALASHKMNIEKIIGIAMEPANSKTTSIDFCQFTKPVGEVDPEMDKLANEVFGPAVRSTENEYPSLSKNS